MFNLKKYILLILVVVIIITITGCSSSRLNKNIETYENNVEDFERMIKIIKEYPEFIITRKEVEDDKDYYTFNGISIVIYNRELQSYIKYDELRLKEYANLIKPYFDKYDLMVIYNNDPSVIDITKDDRFFGAFGWIYMKNREVPDKESLGITKMIRINDYWYAIKSV